MKTRDLDPHLGQVKERVEEILRLAALANIAQANARQVPWVDLIEPTCHAQMRVSICVRVWFFAPQDLQLTEHILEEHLLNVETFHSMQLLLE